MNKVSLAIEIAKRAHKGQTDKLGFNYIDHPLRVRRNLIANPNFLKLSQSEREDAEVAAILHDVVEDSGSGIGSERFTREDLMMQGFSPRSIELVVLLTRTKDISSDDYYLAIQANPLARLIKLADIADNRNRQRVAGLASETAERLEDRYRHAMEVVTMDEEDAAWMRSAIEYDIELTDVEDDANEDEG